ncbi:MAG: ornithine carbamoyltransferase [Dehalococcoidia bacterium]|nr:ornithine carbamoyltransferase [Dehalococcoidia bacterium]
MKGKDLLSICDLSAERARDLFTAAIQMKRAGLSSSLKGKSLALLFEKPSLRTRVSFDVAMHQLGGHCLYLSPAEIGLGTRESIPDVGRTLSRYVDVLAARTFAHATVEALAEHCSVPVINALSDHEHPCQALADLLTMYEHKARLEGLDLAYIGDGNNVANSLLLACMLLGVNFRAASPPAYAVPDDIRERGKAISRGARITIVDRPEEAVEGADVVYTDVWTSMGQEDEAEKRRAAFRSYQVTPALLSKAARDVIFMHPLPAHRGEEVEETVVDSSCSVVFDQAENRLHIQKAILLKALGQS